MCYTISCYFRILNIYVCFFFFFSSRRRHTRLVSDWSSDVCSSDLLVRRHEKIREPLVERPFFIEPIAQVPQAEDQEVFHRSEERRVGKECRYRWWTYL